MEVYFDNSATTKVLPSVADLVLKVMTGIMEIRPRSMERACARNSISKKPRRSSPGH